MAILMSYKCCDCGHEVHSSPLGHYTLMRGECFDFICDNCKEIISLSADELLKMGYTITCPICGKEEALRTWNPIEGKCPKCGGDMKDQVGYFIFAD